MVIKTRLDAVVRLRERTEEQAKIFLARMHRESMLAEQALAQARARAAKDALQAGSAARWHMRELAHARALLEVEKAKQAALQAHQREEAARAEFENAHRQAEAVRRAAENKRKEIILAADRAERKRFDEIAAIRYSSRKQR